MDNLTKVLIWVGVIAVVFGLLWWQGQIKRLKDYISLTTEELKKCTWPTWDELKGHTVVVFLTILILGLFTVAVDQLLFLVFFKL